MAYGRVLVTAASDDAEKATLLVDLDTGASEVLVPYIGGLCAFDDRLFLARLENDRTRIEAYDRDGLVWMRRIRDCSDTHSLCPTEDGLAVCSTGTNEVIRLDREGLEIGRWSPDDAAEGDSWHVNSLVGHHGRLFTTCFGRFDRFRGWAGRIKGSGMLLEVDSGRVVLDGLSAPHDPRRVEGGWFLNDAIKSSTLFCPDSGPPKVVFETPGFARGLEVFEDVLVVGSSSHRLHRRPSSGSIVFVVDRESGRLRNVIPLPYHEVGHIMAAPEEAILSAVRNDTRLGLHGLSPHCGPICESDRIGSIEAVGAPRPSSDDASRTIQTIRLRNRGGRTWSSRDEPPINIACRLLGPEGNALLDGARSGIPLPIPSGRDLTFDVRVDFLDADRPPAPGPIEITLVQEGVAWWSASAGWKPLVVRR